MNKPKVKAASPRATTARKSPPKKVVARTTTPPQAADAAPRPKNILSAGIKALTHAHEEAVARQSRVFESLLGLGQRRAAEQAAAPLAATTLDPFGFRKFEDVFDQRVANALEHIGVPTAQAFAELQAEVERLRETVARLESPGRKR
jgi:DNA-binding transcriptional regulator YbjK